MQSAGIKAMGKDNPVIRVLIVRRQIDGFILSPHQYGVITG
jgi:hypothetical protein